MMTDEMFIKRYEELLDKGYCNCNEMNCLDNNVPRKILNIVKGTKLEAKQLLEENQQLKSQLEYLRSGEYYNQLRFERDMLQNVVDNGEVSKEDKEFIDMTHRNTELLEENKKLKEQSKQRDEALEKTIIVLNQYKDFCKRNIENEPYDNISKQNNIYWNYCISKLDYILDIIKKHKVDEIK